ncbi:MAG: helix-turn-helix domain-containing protein, partial [Candidatus Puniceispirillales bacterium]
YMITKRTRLLRERKGWRQKRMANALQVSLSNYQNYEYRSILPVYLMTTFCDVVDIDVREFISNEITSLDVALLKWHEEASECKVLLENMRSNFVDGKIVPITKLPLPDSEGS